MKTEDIRELLIRQRKIYEEFLIERERRSDLDALDEFVTVITGVRRCGKSTLLKQAFFEESYFVNFDDERFINFRIEDFSKLFELLHELFGNKKYFIFDEVQNVTGWERFVRRLNNEKMKVFITGSNANLLSRELGTYLTGRTIMIELYPFSFREFLLFKGLSFDVKRLVLEEKAELKRQFNEYMEIGGFPEYVRTKKPEYLQALFNNIIFRDIVGRYKIRAERELREIVLHAMSNLAKEISYNSLRKLTGLSNTSTISDFYYYFENSYLLFTVHRYDNSLKKQINNPKKVYCIDTGLAFQLGFRTSEDKGRLLENIVFLQLKRLGKDIYFHKRKYECDFLIKDGIRITNAIQVCHSLDTVNREREYRGLCEAIEEHKLNQGTILTFEQEEEINYNGKKVIIKPVYKWLLEGNALQ